MNAIAPLPFGRKVAIAVGKARRKGQTPPSMGDKSDKSDQARPFVGLAI